MNEQTEQQLRYTQMRFIGKIIAGFTHEIKNHLAIIKESAGLMDDMLRLGKTPADGGQYLEIIGSIQEQVDNSIVLFRFLNRFAHRMDAPLAVFQINESLEELVALMTRFANQKKITLEKNFDPGLPEVYNNPSLFQLVVFNFIEGYLQKLGYNTSVLIKTEKKDNLALVSLSCAGDMEKVQLSGEFAAIACDIVEKEMNGKIIHEGENRITLMLKHNGTSNK